MSRLGEIHRKSGQVPAPNSSGRLRGLLEQDLRGETVTMPIVGEVWVELIGHDHHNAAEGASIAELTAAGVPAAGAWGLSYESERAKRTLAHSVRELDKVTPIGSVEEWGAFDDDVIAACWFVYGDVRERLDPIGVDRLTEDDVRDLDDAIEKKNRMAMLRCGVAKLSLYLLTTAARHANSPTPPSLPGES